jgi:hypothetical protein
MEIMIFSFFDVVNMRQIGNFVYMCCTLSRQALELLFQVFAWNMNIAVRCAECVVDLIDMDIPTLWHAINNTDPAAYVIVLSTH